MLNLIVLLLPVALADSFIDKCPDIPTCAKAVGPMLGQKYVFDGDVKGKNDGTSNLALNHDNAEMLFTNFLYSEGFARLPLGPEGTFRIVRQRDIRDLNLPTINADERTAPRLPEVWDFYTLKYKATNPEAVEQIARLARSFMPANARIVPAELSGMLLVTDAAPNLKKIYAIIKENDQKPTAEMKKKWREDEERRRANPPPPPPGHGGPGPGPGGPPPPQNR
jgi:type II secretory pathway component GspD/PulD (secretin)